MNPKESQRIVLQNNLDDEKTALERNRLGQFATPTVLAQSILRHGMKLLNSKEAINFVDPAIGTGSFYSALIAETEGRNIASAIGYEIDAHYGLPSKDIWKETNLQIRIEDFTKATPLETDKANLLICNPPYVRHHHLHADFKKDLQTNALLASGVAIQGLSGLYCYFLALSHRWMRTGAIAGWLIPSEFMDVNYGSQLKEYLLNKVTLLHIHRFDPTDEQFSDALVSSAVVWFRNEPPKARGNVLFTLGGSLEQPRNSRRIAIDDLRFEKKWTRYPNAKSKQVTPSNTLGDIFDIKRGIATGDNSFFIMSKSEIESRELPLECFQPVLPSSRYLIDDEVFADAYGNPIIDDPRYLLNTRLSEAAIQIKYPKLWKYLEAGQQGADPIFARYLCGSRNPWYAQEKRPAAPFICTYMGRQRTGLNPFRFILNHSKATACNVYLMLYPKIALAELLASDPSKQLVVWNFLKSIGSKELMEKGRVYGGGLHKLEPKELRSVSADRLVKILGLSSLEGLGQYDLLTNPQETHASA